MGVVRTVRVHAPQVATMEVVVRAASGVEHRTSMRQVGTTFVGSVVADDGDRYWLVADGRGPLVDPSAAEVVFEHGVPVAVFRDGWPEGAQLPVRHADPVVYEVHVRGFGRTFAGVAARLDHVVALGVNVIELMPVHPFDDADNYWGYMPVVWGAVHRGYAEGEDAAAELAALVAAAHERDVEVWLDVVFNHTAEGDASMPTRTLRAFDDARSYLHQPGVGYVNDSGCGNTIDVSSPAVRRLVLEALERYAALGIDGFRFDLASILARDGGWLVQRIGDWAERRGVRLVAEAWDLGAYLVGSAFPDHRWAQWNDRFRDEMRGFLRGEPGRVPAVMLRVAGSPDLFPDDAGRSVNFLTAHDGLTMHDLTAVTSDRHHSWDCGPALRGQQLRNAFCLLLLSAGTPMFVMGDEFARTQHGHDNPYDVDGPLTWVDWQRREVWGDLVEFVTGLIDLRRRTAGSLRHGGVRTYGVAGPADESYESRSLAWATDDVYVMANMWWEPLHFTVQEPGPWRRVLVTAESADAVAGERLLHAGDTVEVAPRSVTVLAGGTLLS